jgi:hypothetical protein
LKFDASTNELSIYFGRNNGVTQDPIYKPASKITATPLMPPPVALGTPALRFGQYSMGFADVLVYSGALSVERYYSERYVNPSIPLVLWLNWNNTFWSTRGSALFTYSCKTNITDWTGLNPNVTFQYVFWFHSSVVSNTYFFLDTRVI